MYLSTRNQKDPQKDSRLLRTFQGAAPGFRHVPPSGGNGTTHGWYSGQGLNCEPRWEYRGSGYGTRTRWKRRLWIFLEHIHSTKVEAVCHEPSAIVWSWHNRCKIRRYLPHRRIITPCVKTNHFPQYPFAVIASIPVYRNEWQSCLQYFTSLSVIVRSGATWQSLASNFRNG